MNSKQRIYIDLYYVSFIKFDLLPLSVQIFFYVNSLLLHVCDILKLNVIYNLFAHDGYPHRGIYKNDWLGKAWDRDLDCLLQITFQIDVYFIVTDYLVYQIIDSPNYAHLPHILPSSYFTRMSWYILLDNLKE